MAVFEKHICLDDVRDHLCLNAARLTTYDKMKQEAAGVLLARQGRSAASGDSSGPTLMDIGWIGWTAKARKAKAEATRAMVTRARMTKARGTAKGRTSLSTRARVRRTRGTRISASDVVAKGIRRSIATSRKSMRKATVSSVLQR